jgi:PPM family protein phosphatase
MRGLRAGSASDMGRIRSTNQDRLVVSDDMVAVADGMGGHVGGEVAARTAIDALVHAFGEDRSSEGLVAAVRYANRAIFDQGRAQGDLRGMGTTLTAAALVDDGGEAHLALVNVGDSRAYLYHRGDLTQLTDDHSLVEEMVKHGEITRAEAAVHPHRHVLTRALGLDPDVEIDAWRLVPPDGGRILLCSDGLTNEMSEDEIASVLGGVEDPGQAAQELVRQALAHGGNDNVTAVVVDIWNDDPSAALPSVQDESASSPRPRKPGPAGSTEGLTESVPAVGGEVVAGFTGGAAAAAGGVGTVAGVGSQASMAGATTNGATGSGNGRGAHGRGGGRGGGTSAAGASGRGGGAHGQMILVTHSRGGPREKVVTARVILFCLLLAGILGGIVGVTEWFAQASYYVGLAGSKVAIYQGRPGGFLWFNPSLVEMTPLTVSDLIPPEVPSVRSGVLESSFASAQQYVQLLVDAKSELPLYSPTTTVPPATTNPPPATPTSTTLHLPTTTTSPPPPTTRAPTTTTFPSTTSGPTTTTKPPTTTTKPPTTTTKPPAKNSPTTTTAPPAATTTTRG